MIVENRELIIQKEKTFKIAKRIDDAKESITINQYGLI
jgi:hypothetical protein